MHNSPNTKKLFVQSIFPNCRRKMDSIKKKMEKLSNETADAESRIAHFEEIKAQNEAEADKFEEQVRSRLRRR